LPDHLPDRQVIKATIGIHDPDGDREFTIGIHSARPQ
jgi:hypothetical protein